MYSQYVSKVHATHPNQRPDDVARSEIERQVEAFLAAGGEIHTASPTDSRAYREGGKKRTRKEQIKYRKRYLNKMNINN